MPKIALLFDVDNTLVRESKDISQYYFEAIRSVYGLYIDGIRVSDYDGMSAKETITSILTRNGQKREEIDAKLEQFMEELPYAHYNVAGHDAAFPMDGAKDLLAFVSKNADIIAGIATGHLERIVKDMFHRAGIDESWVRFGSYGNASSDMQRIVEHAVEEVQSKDVTSKESIFLVSSSVYPIRAASSLGIKTIGVCTGRYTSDNLREAGAKAVIKSLKDARKYLH